MTKSVNVSISCNFFNEETPSVSYISVATTDGTPITAKRLELVLEEFTWQIKAKIEELKKL